MTIQRQQFEATSFDEAVETLSYFRNLQERRPAKILFKFSVGILPADVVDEYHAEAKALGLLVSFAA